MVLESLNIAAVLINNVFGGVLITYLALLLIFSIMCMIGRLSPMFIFYWMGLFTLAFGAISLGGIVPMIGVILALIYFWQSSFKSTTGGI